jgi:hypothetical protein
VTGEHVPWIDPGGATQGRPAQQSALVVHDWPLIWQEFALHWSCPLVPTTHGSPVQHSVAVEHALPVATHPVPPSPGSPVAELHRGTPKGSSTHASNFGRAVPQQSAVEVEIPHV